MYDVEKIIDQYFPKFDETNTALVAAKYAVGSGGKRLRPTFALNCADMIKAVDDKVKRIAVAIEFLHTYSLIHDDLPAMDDDDIRRGKPSCHIAFGEAAAILAGDALQNLAFEVLADVENSSENYLKAINYIAKMSGASGMIYGQCLDISGNNLNEKQYFNMIKHKTANMFMASVVAPAIYFDIDNAQIGLLENFAENYGILFQIADDLTDNDGWVNENKDRAIILTNNAYDNALTSLSMLKYDTKYFESALENIHSKLA
ncbi:MAG TPA: polyprenyl synthetase family protein [Eubacteriales bacterium]|nr:polyprenyl synthetase family protein [Eubacteriales bacterium]